MSASKPKKAPKLFPRRIGRRRFERAILRRIHVGGERDFLLALYSPGAGGDYERPPELSDEQVRRLRELAGSIQANRGVVRTGKLVILAVLVAAVVVFSLFFKNPLVEGAMERSLEGVFAARAEVSGLDFRPLRGSLTFSRLEVADREAPMRNLFELGWTQVSLDTAALLKKRFVLNNVETRDLAWNTERGTSGALESTPGTRDVSAETPGTGEAGALGRALSTTLARLDVQALLAEEAAALRSPARAQEANREIQAAISRWTDRVARGRQDVEALSGQVEALRSTDVKAIRNLPEAQALAAQLQDLVPAVRRLQEDLSEVDRALEADVGAVEALRREVQGAMDEDVSFLRSRLDLSGGGLKNLASSLASRALEQLLGRVYGYAMRAGEFGRALVERKRERRKEGPLRRAGQDVAFPTQALPRFLLRQLGVSVTDAGASGSGPGRTEGSIRNLSSDPDLLAGPARFSFSRESGIRTVSVDGFLDNRKARTENAGLDLRADNLPFALSRGLESVSLGGITGSLHLRTSLVLERDGRMSGEGRIELPELSVLSADAGDLLGATIAETLNGLSTGTMDFRYTVGPDRSMHLELTSNLDDLLSRRLSEKLAALSAEYAARLRGALEDRLRETLAENGQLYAVLEDLEAAAGGNLADAGAYQRIVTARQKELEGKLTELRQKATDTLRKEAEKQLEGVTDQLQLPKITF